MVVATGYYDLPNLMNIPGEDLPKVHHYYNDPHPYYDLDVVVIGGKNSAAIAALELWRHGARVTVVYRGSAMQPHIKYWILPDIENRIRNGQITAYFNTEVTRIDPDTHQSDPDIAAAGTRVIKNDAVFAMTGYIPDFEFLASLGIRIEGEDRCPTCDPASLESNIPGLYLAGVIVAGDRTNEIFIENGRFHGRQIASDLRVKLTSSAAEPLQGVGSLQTPYKVCRWRNLLDALPPQRRQAPDGTRLPPGRCRCSDHGRFAASSWPL